MAVLITSDNIEKLFHQYLSMKTSGDQNTPIMKKDTPIVDYVCTRGLAKQCSTKKQRRRQMCTKCYSASISCYLKKTSPPKRNVPPMERIMRKRKNVIVDL